MGERTSFFTIDRKLLEDPLWRAEPFTKGQAWIDLIGRASYKDTEDLKRGELIISERTLAARWKWSRGKVDRFLEYLEAEGMITRASKRASNRASNGTSITIEKYAFYQNSRASNEASNEASNRATFLLYKQNKTNINNINNLTITPDGVREELEKIFGDRTGQLLEDVRAYYEGHPEREFPGWKEAVIQFNANQQRWGKTRKKSADPMARAIAAFMEEAE